MQMTLRSTQPSVTNGISSREAVEMHHCIATLVLENDLLLNPYQSDVALYVMRPGRKRPGLMSSISIAVCAINVSETLKIIGDTLDATLSFDNHITSVVRACNFHLCALHHIRHSISQSITNTIVCSIVGSRLAYCNALLFDEPVKTVSRLSRAPYNLARFSSTYWAPAIKFYLSFYVTNNNLHGY